MNSISDTASMPSKAWVLAEQILNCYKQSIFSLRSKTAGTAATVAKWAFLEPFARPDAHDGASETRQMLSRAGFSRFALDKSGIFY